MNYGVTYKGWSCCFAQFISETDAQDYADYLNERAEKNEESERYLVLDLDD